MKQILLDFWQFIKHPKDLRDTSSNKWNVFFTLFLAELALLIFYFPIINVVDKYVVLEETFTDSYNIATSFFLFVLLIPFIEELFVGIFYEEQAF